MNLLKIIVHVMALPIEVFESRQAKTEVSRIDCVIDSSKYESVLPSNDVIPMVSHDENVDSFIKALYDMV
jgi:hypothetical protein